MCNNWSKSLEESDRNPDQRRPRKGRGALTNRVGRYESLAREAIDDGWGSLDETPPPLQTTLTKDASRSVITQNQSPDVPFEQSINPYRGCEHGCIYCFARPTHAWLRLLAGRRFRKPACVQTGGCQALDHRAGETVLRVLTDRAWHQHRSLSTGRKTPAQHQTNSPRSSRLTITPSPSSPNPLLVERDIDLLAPMAEQGLASVSISVTSLERTLSRKMEPRAAAPHRRIKIIERLSEAGIPTGTLVAPIIPALNDHEIEAILETVHAAGARAAGYCVVRLPLEIKDLFVEWLETHYPLKAEHVLNRMRDLHGGKLYDATFGTRQKGTGAFAELLASRFRLTVKRLGFPSIAALDRTKFRRPNVNEQLGLFDAG